MMENKDVLVSWIGNADCIAMAKDLGDEGKELLKAAKIKPIKVGSVLSRVKTAVQTNNFKKVVLLSNYQKKISERFALWVKDKSELRCESKLYLITLENPYDFDGIYQRVDKVLEEVAKNGQGKLNILLTPGTRVMALVWVLLGKIKYPANFWQIDKYKDEIKKVEIADTFFAKLAPELLRDRDTAFHKLALQKPSEIEGFESLVGESLAIKESVAIADRAARYDVSILLLGESGTGKEMFAQAIHKASPRRDKPFMPINCAAIPEALLESELFGHKRGAFTGADKDKEGLFARADGGTLFLDEIGECRPEFQSKLLRVLQPPDGKPISWREFKPLGDTAVKNQQSDVRIIAATNKDLEAEMKASRFREDLYYRLANIIIPLPPLRERKDDVPLLARKYLEKINNEFKVKENKTFSPQINDFIKNYDWPGNIRQLNNYILQAWVMADESEIDFQAIGGESSSQAPSLTDQPLENGFSIKEQIKVVTRHYLRNAMVESKGEKKRAVHLLGLKSYQTLDNMMKSVGMSWEKND